MVLINFLFTKFFFDESGEAVEQIPEDFALHSGLFTILLQVNYSRAFCFNANFILCPQIYYSYYQCHVFFQECPHSCLPQVLSSNEILVIP